MNNEVTGTIKEVKGTEKSRISTRMIAITGITAAVYMAATLAIAPLSYGAIQLRFSEIMVLLAFIDPAYGAGLILGCAMSNLFSTVGMIDVIFGTLGTVVAVVGIIKSKRLFMATLWPTFSMLVVTAGICIGADLPYFPTLITVMLGEFAVVTCLGYPIFKTIIKNEKLVEALKIKK
ncbi:MAG: QueT transporter family protein [Lachnospiraceae bacterium]|nr:QueT transporter family protein [Lachnospiraceae bacterium]